MTIPDTPPSGTARHSGLTLRSLAVGYRSAAATAGPVLTVPAATARTGELTCLLGRNGTGKSTLLRTVAGLQRPLSGDVLIDGEPVTGCTPRQMARRVSIVLTDRPAPPDLTVAETVALGRTPYTGFWGTLTPGDRAAVSEALARTGASALADRRLATLSDGERQRVMVAMALAQHTPVMLLDEPTAFLDFPGKVALMRLLRRVAREEGKAVLLSIHDLQLALQTADRLWLADGGTLREGTPRSMAADGTLARYVECPGVAFDAATLAVRMDEMAR